METKVSVWEGFDDGLAKSAETCAATVVDAIRSRVFWPPAERLTYDDFETLFFTTMEECVEPPFEP
jgi:hypothetical protein